MLRLKAKSSAKLRRVTGFCVAHLGVAQPYRDAVRSFPRATSAQKSLPHLSMRHTPAQTAQTEIESLSRRHPHALGQRRHARTSDRAICDDRHHTNLVRTAPLLRADMIL